MAEHSKEAIAAMREIYTKLGLSKFLKNEPIDGPIDLIGIGAQIIDEKHTGLRAEIKSLKRVIFGINKTKEGNKEEE